MRQSKVCGPRRVYARAVPTLSHEMVCVKGVYEERVCCRRRRRFRRCHPVAPGKCESRVTEYGALEFARGLPPLSHNPGSWRKGAGCASATDAATGAATHTQRLEMGGTVSRTREGFAAQRRQCRGVARTACWGGGRKAAERTQAGHFEAEDKPSRRAWIFLCLLLFEKNSWKTSARRRTS